MEGTQHGPVITVVIPTFNRADTIVAAVDSVLSQPGPPRLVIVVDDGSTDATVDLLRAHGDDRVQVIVAPHQGVCSARNRGARAVTTQWLAFLDSDDILLGGWIEAMTAELAAGAVLVTCAATLRYPDGRSERSEPTDLGPAFGSIHGLFLAGSFATTTDLFHAVGGYLDGLGYAENTHLGMRLGSEVAARGQRAACRPDALLQVHAAQRVNDPPRLYRAGAEILRASGDLLERDPQLHAQYLAITGVAGSRCGEGRAARRLLWRAWRLRPSDLRRPARLLRASLPVLRWR